MGGRALHGGGGGQSVIFSFALSDVRHDGAADPAREMGQQRAGGCVRATNRSFYLLLLLTFCFLGISPYLFFTVDPWYIAIVNHIRGGYGFGISWTISRGATINTTSLMATFQVQLLELGYVAGGFAAFYAIMIARSAPGKIFGWAVWVFWMLMAVGTGARSNTLTAAMPACALLFLKFNARAATLLRRVSVKAYIS